MPATDLTVMEGTIICVAVTMMALEELIPADTAHSIVTKIQKATDRTLA